MKIIFTYILLFFFSTPLLFSQTTKDDTISMIRTLLKEKKYGKAEELLKAYYTEHSEDIETNWLYAQVAHWNHNNIIACKLFQKAISLSPKNTSIQLDYARMLYESGKLKKAKRVIKELKNEPEAQAEALLMEANIAYWEGDIIGSKAIIAELQKLYPNTSITNELSKNIAATTATYLKTNFEYQKDSQPLSYFTERIELDKYCSWLFHPKVAFTNYNYNPVQQVFTAMLSNQTSVNSIGLSATVSGGVYNNFSDKSSLIGGLEFQQKLATHTMVKVGYDKLPYTGTQTSTAYNLTQSNAFGELTYENPKLLSLHAGYNYQYFQDNNAIQTLSAWLISKPLIVGRFKAQFGYGYNNSDAKRNTYTPTTTLADAIANFTANNTINGSYIPYFTPKNQVVHAALLLLNYKPTINLSITAKGNYGFYASCQNPYIYLNTDSSNTTVFNTGYYKTTFHPFDLTGEVNYNLSDRFSLKTTYTYQETFFYNRNNFNLGISYRF